MVIECSIYIIISELGIVILVNVCTMVFGVTEYMYCTIYVGSYADKCIYCIIHDDDCDVIKCIYHSVCIII